jgi:hypothetical protein
MASEPTKIYVSYTQSDRDWAEWIAGVIEGAGYQTIIQAWDFRPGENFVLRMQQARAELNLTIAVMSDAYLNSGFTQGEWASCFRQDPAGKKRQLIPVRVTPCIPRGLWSSIIYIDLVGLNEHEAEQALVEGLKPSGRPVQPPRFPGKREVLGVSAAPFPPAMSSYQLPRETDLAQPKPKLFTMPTDSKPRVFVSHSSKDKPFVRKLVEAIQKHLLNVWVDEHEIKVGDSLVGKISEALKGADYLVIVLSQASVSSRWVEQELNAALTNQISGKGVVLPVLLEDCELPILLRDRLYADFRADFNVGLQALLAAFEHEGESAVDVAQPGPTPAAPASITPAKLLENLQGLISDRMSRTEVGRLWYAVLETRMDDEMAQRPKSDCVIELLEQAKSRNKLPRLTEELCKIRPDLADP